MAEAPAASCAAPVDQGVLPSARGSLEMSRSGPSVAEADGRLSITPDKLENILHFQSITFFLFFFFKKLLKHNTSQSQETRLFLKS